MKFYLEKGTVNEARLSEDDKKELMILITLTSEQIEKLNSGEPVGFRMPE